MRVSRGRTCECEGEQLTSIGLNLESKTHNSKPTRIGVFICDCGDRVAGILDTETLVKSASRLPEVVHAGRAPYWCSAAGRELLKETIRTRELNRFVVAGCSPRTHRALFQETVTEAGGNPYLLGLANIREGCAWPHRAGPKAATIRALDQIAMEAARVAAVTPDPPVDAQITPAASVIGGGVAGMTAALELAEAGVPVTLFERSTTLGGKATVDLTKLIEAVQTHPNITTMFDSHIVQVNGSIGAYRIGITHHASRSTQPGPFGAIVVATGSPGQGTRKLAELLRIPQDAEGFLPEFRVRLRPGHYVERGIYVCGSAHYPCDASEARFQAYSAASRTLRYLRQGKLTKRGLVAEVNREKCNGCGDCFTMCPFFAVTMTRRPTGLSLSHIDPLLCTGCGNCVSICPVGAVTVSGWTDAQLEAQMQVALRGGRGVGSLVERGIDESRVLIFACEWSGYAAAELAGAQKISYPSNVRMIRLDCTGRLQPGLILKALEMGAAGVLVLGCEPKSCHYERGNERAAAAYEQIEAITGLLGLPSSRLRLAWIPPDDGQAFAELVTEFVKGVEKTGMGRGEHRHARRTEQYEVGIWHD